jgi:DNA-binding NtrC family response regulator
MSENSLALLVYGDEETFGALRKALQSLGIPTLRVNTYEDARRELREASLPKLVFTSTELPDGNWEDIVRLAAGACEPVQVIVVRRFIDLKLYLQVLQSGAFDFIVPPFLTPGLAHVVRCATRKRPGRSEPTKRQAAAT